MGERGKGHGVVGGGGGGTRSRKGVPTVVRLLRSSGCRDMRLLKEGGGGLSYYIV